MVELKAEQVSKKIIIMGLDNSGKTSILLSLKEDTNLLSYFSIHPTLGVNIEEFEVDDSIMTIWEFGGQKKYREEYIKNKHYLNYFNEIDNIIYVMDVQDMGRYDESLIYLEKVIDFLDQNEIKVDLCIFFHKFDPNLTKKDKFRDIDKIVLTRLLSKIKDKIPENINCKFFKTTIYTIFEKFLIM